MQLDMAIGSHLERHAHGGIEGVRETGTNGCPLWQRGRLFVTDRRDLEKQLSDTAVLTGESLTRVKPRKQGDRTIPSYVVLQEVLRREGKDLVFAMIQKYRGKRIDPVEAFEEDEDEDDECGGRPEWDNSVRYEKNDEVHKDGTAYKSKKASKKKDPTKSKNSKYWIDLGDC